MKEFIKNKKMFLVGLAFLTIICFVIGNIMWKHNKREWAIDNLLIYSDVKKWYDKGDAVLNIQSLFIGFRDFIEDEDGFYKKYLTSDDKERIIYEYEMSFIEFGLSREEIYEILDILSDENEDDKYNNFDTYTEYLGEKAYYSKTNDFDDVYPSFSASISDGVVEFKKKYYFDDEDEDDWFVNIHYKIILKDDKSRILDIIEYDGFETPYRFEPIIYIENEDVAEVDYYIISCY